MHLFLQAGHKNPPGEGEPVGAVSAGGLVKAGKPHVNVCPGLLAAATAGLSHSSPDPWWQTRVTGGFLQSRPTSAEEERKNAKGKRLNTHQCLTDKKPSTRLAQVDLIPRCEV